MVGLASAAGAGGRCAAHGPGTVGACRPRVRDRVVLGYRCVRRAGNSAAGRTCVRLAVAVARALFRLEPNVTAILSTHLPQLLTTAFVIALIASLDGLLSAAGVDVRLNTRHKPNRVLLGQGLANVASAAFGGLPVVQSLIVPLASYRAGGRTRASGIVAAFVLLLVMIVGSPIIGIVPAAATAGVMVIVGLGSSTAEPHRLAGTSRRQPRPRRPVVAGHGAHRVRRHRILRLPAGNRRRFRAVGDPLRRLREPIARAQRGYGRNPGIAADLPARPGEPAAGTRCRDSPGRDRRGDFFRHGPQVRAGNGSGGKGHPLPDPRSATGDDDRRLRRARVRSALPRAHVPKGRSSCSQRWWRAIATRARYGRTVHSRAPRTGTGSPMPTARSSMRSVTCSTRRDSERPPTSCRSRSCRFSRDRAAATREAPRLPLAHGARRPGSSVPPRRARRLPVRARQRFREHPREHRRWCRVGLPARELRTRRHLRRDGDARRRRPHRERRWRTNRRWLTC